MKLQSKQEFELYALMYVAAMDMKTSKEELKLLAKEARPLLLEEPPESSGESFTVQL